MSVIDAVHHSSIARPARGRPALLGAIASEAVKLRSLRSNWILSAAALVLIIGSGTMQCVGLIARLTDPRFAGQLIEARPMQFVDAVLWAQVLIAVIAVLAATGEYGSGQIKLSLLALPTRLPLLAAKAITVALLAFVIGVVGAAVALAVPLAVLAESGIDYPIDLPTAVGLALGSGAYLAAIAALSSAAGMLLRHVVPALAVTLATVTILPSIIASIPVDVIRDAAAYFPTTAGRMLISDLPTTAALEPWQGYLVLLAWVAAVWIAAAVSLRARDA